MNDVPVLFLERVVFQFTRGGTLSTGRHLSGLPGHVASEAYAKKCRQYMRMTNGCVEEESYLNWEDKPVDIETPNRKHIHYITISTCAGKEEYNSDPQVVERVLSATKGKHVLLSLRTSNISKEIAKCVDSIRLVFELQLHTKITTDLLKLMRSLVQKNTLNKLLIANGVEIEDGLTQLLIDLLKQKQFHQMFLRAKCSAALNTIIASWSENSEEMVGKIISCKDEFSELQLSATEFPFEKCKAEEEREAKRAYYIAADWSRITTKSVLRNQNGSAVYCFSKPSLNFKSEFVFA